MGREMSYDDLHVCYYRITARNPQDRTVEQMWCSSVPHFPGFKILSILDSHREVRCHIIVRNLR